MAPRITAKDLDVRVSVLESQYCDLKDSIEGFSASNTVDHDKINVVLTKIQTHMAQQNGAIPYIKEGVQDIRGRLTSLEDDQAETEKGLVTVSVGTKAVYAIFFTGIGAIITFMVSKVLGG